MENKIESTEFKKVTTKEALDIIEFRKPLGLFYEKGNNAYIGIDNSSGHANVEEFEKLEDCVMWLKGELSLEEVFEQSKVKIAKDLIRNFLIKEYKYEANEIEFNNLRHIPVAHTQTEDGQHDIDVTVDLENNSINKHLDGRLVESKLSKDIHELINKELIYLDFSDLVYLDEVTINKFKKDTERKVRKGDIVKIPSSTDETIVLEVEGDDALLFNGYQYIVAHNIERNEAEPDKVSWAYGGYYQEFSDVDFGKRKGENFSGDIISLLEDNYKEVVKSLISMDLNIDDEEILDEMYCRFMDKDDMRLINDEFEEIEYDLEGEWDMEI